MGLTAVTLLGENTVPILAGLCSWLTEATGVDIAADRRLPGTSAEAAERAGDADLIWGCGFLVCQLVDSGRLDAEIVAAPVFAGETGPVYHSVIVTADPAIEGLCDASGGVVAINEMVSWSGHLALVDHLAAIGSNLSMFERVVTTGSHAASVEAVARGDADVAAIDHTVWAQLARQLRAGTGLRVIDRTKEWPAPPFALHRRRPTDERRTMAAAMVAIPPKLIVDLAGVVPASRADYEVMLHRRG